MRHVLLTLLLAFSAVYVAQSQIVADTFYIPNYPIPEIYYTDQAPELPENVWNHKLKYFPDSLIEQIGPTCGQTAGIFNCMTYMFNRAYDWEADSSNTFPPNHTFNLLSMYEGVSTFDSWNIVKSQGHPSRKEYETINFNASLSNPDFNYNHFEQFWMNGYDNYYKSFFNRISGYYSLNLITEQDLKMLKHYLNDKFETNSDGGVAIFYSNPFSTQNAIDKIIVPELYLGSKYSTYYCMIHDTCFNQHLPTHCMAITGYYKNDSIDFNGDGIISDTMDINNDGIIDFHDNETTLWIVLNSTSGRPIILLKYDAICLFWNQQVFFPIPDTTYSPELTFKVKIKHPQRGNLKICAGISSDLNSDKPEILIDFPVFKFYGGPFCMTGVDSLSEPEILEFGIDITDLKNYIPENGVYKVFMKIENHGLPNGELQDFSIIDYTKATPEENQIVNSPEIIFTGDNLYSKIMDVESRNYNNHFRVVNPTLSVGEINKRTEISIFTTSGQAPYEYSIENVKTYGVHTSVKDFPSDEELLYDTIWARTLNLDWLVPIANEQCPTLKIANTGEITFYNGSLDTFEERYPYETTILKHNYLCFSPYARFFFLGSYQKPTAIRISDSEIEIFRQYRKRINSVNYFYPELYIKITREGVIEVTYSDSIPQTDICAQIRSNIGNYFVPYVESDVFNTVTFTPIAPDSLFTIDSTGLLTMRAVSQPGVYEVYVKVKDANGDEFTKRIEIDIIDENIIGNLYPNPTADIIYSDIFAEQSQDCIIEVFNTVGQLMFKENRTLNLGINSLSLNVKSIPLSQGSYIYRVNIGGKSQSKSFVVTE